MVLSRKLALKIAHMTERLLIILLSFYALRSAMQFFNPALDCVAPCSIILYFSKC